MRPAIPALLLCLTLPCAARATPPAGVLDALDGAMTALEDPAVVSSYLITSRGDHSKPNGKDHHTFSARVRITLVADGDPEVETLESVYDGEPVERKRKDDDGEGHTISFELAPPAGDTLGSYVFGETAGTGAELSATFEPADGARRDGLARGTLWWNAETGHPTALEFVPLKNPRFVQSMDTRLEFARTGDALHISRIVTSGQGGIPGFRQRMAVDMVFGEVQLAN